MYIEYTFDHNMSGFDVDSLRLEEDDSTSVHKGVQETKYTGYLLER